MTRLYKFADDSMMGRLAGTKWNDMGTDYIASEVKRLGLTTDLDENVVRAHGLEVGLVDVKVAAVDATWSGLKFVRRVSDR